jgi:hypothetical protein
MMFKLSCSRQTSKIEKAFENVVLPAGKKHFCRKMSSKRHVDRNNTKEDTKASHIAIRQ